MDEPSEGLVWIIGLVTIAIAFALIAATDQRIKREGAFLTSPSSPRSRGYAILLTVFIGAFFLIEWFAGLRYYTLLILALALLAYGLGQERWIALFQGYRTIVGVQSMSTTELDLYLQAGARFVTFQYCISILVISHIRYSDIYFVKPGETRLGEIISYSLLSLIFGWLAFPHGPINTVRSLVTNLHGGKDVTAQMVALYRRMGNVPDLGKISLSQLPT